MNFCNKWHEEIVFDGRECPMCRLTVERDAALAELEETNERLSARIAELLDEKDAYRSELRI